MWPAQQAYWGAQAYHNYASDDVDWGALAQQWIHMKEAAEAGTGGAPPMHPPLPPQPPPPPPLPRRGLLPTPPPPEELPDAPPGETSRPPPPPPPLRKVTVVDEDCMDIDNEGLEAAPPIVRPPLPNAPWVAPANQYAGPGMFPPAVTSNFTGSVPGMYDGCQDAYGYYGSGVPPKPLMSIDTSQVARAGKDFLQAAAVPTMDEFAMDAARRRSLPPWIREGLEKMEREKAKREQREALLKQRDELFKQRHSEEQARVLMENPSKSKFDSDGEDEPNQVEEPENGRRSSGSSDDEHRPSFAESAPLAAYALASRGKKRRSRFTSRSASPEAPPTFVLPSLDPRNKVEVSSKYPGFVKAEVRSGTKLPAKLDLSDLDDEQRLRLQMVVVKAFVTELLLDVTGILINDYAADAIGEASVRKSASIKKEPKDSDPLQSKASLKALGLAAYGSGSESDSEDDKKPVSEKLHSLLDYQSSDDGEGDSENEEPTPRVDRPQKSPCRVVKKEWVDDEVGRRASPTKEARGNGLKARGGWSDESPERTPNGRERKFREKPDRLEASVQVKEEPREPGSAPDEPPTPPRSKREETSEKKRKKKRKPSKSSSSSSSSSSDSESSSESEEEKKKKKKVELTGKQRERLMAIAKEIVAVTKKKKKENEGCEKSLSEENPKSAGKTDDKEEQTKVMEVKKRKEEGKEVKSSEKKSKRGNSSNRKNRKRDEDRSRRSSSSSRRRRRRDSDRHRRHRRHRSSDSERVDSDRDKKKNSRRKRSRSRSRKRSRSNSRRRHRHRSRDHHRRHH